jgi:hypothetical protein
MTRPRRSVQRFSPRRVLPPLRTRALPRRHRRKTHATTGRYTPPAHPHPQVPRRTATRRLSSPDARTRRLVRRNVGRPPANSVPLHPPPTPQGRPALFILHSGPRIPPKVSRLPSPDVSTPLDRVSIRVDTRFSRPRREKPLLPSRRVSTPLDTSDLVRAFQTRETSTVKEFGARRASPMGRLLGTFVRTYGSVSASVSNGAVRQYGDDLLPVTRHSAALPTTSGPNPPGGA